MRQLLTDIQTRLQSQIATVADADVNILLDEYMLPAGFGLPSIGIKDGQMQFVTTDVSARRQYRHPQVRISAYVKVNPTDSPEQAVFDVADLVEEIVDALNNWKLGSGYFRSVPLYEESSESLDRRSDEWPSILKKTVVVEFRRVENV